VTANIDIIVKKQVENFMKDMYNIRRFMCFKKLIMILLDEGFGRESIYIGDGPPKV
jgi:hypothetical protein